MVKDTPRSRTLVGMILGVAVAYWLSARLGLLLAIPPGYATAVWPPSGIALGAVLVWGRRVLPGVWLGSFAANLPTAAGEGLDWEAMLLPAGIALGAACQAGVAAALVRRWIGTPLNLVEDSRILRFLMLASLIGSGVNATFSPALLALSGKTSWADYPSHWLTWWVGDAIGALIFTPLLLIFFAQPREHWASRRRVVAGPLLLSFALTTAFFAYARAVDEPSWLMHTVLLGGLAFTGLLGGFLLILTGRTLKVESLVRERTLALAANNERLRREIEERALAEEQLHTLWVAIEQSPAAIIITDAAARIHYVNPRFIETSGYSADEILGRRPSALRSRPAAPESYRTIRAKLAQEGGWRGEIISRHKRGQPYWEEVHIAPVYDGQGTLTHFVGVKFDISGRKSMERALRDSNRKFEDVLAAASEVSIIATDVRGTITLFNRGAERMLGYRAEDMIDRVTPACIHLDSEIVARGEELSATLGIPVQGFRVFVEMAERESRELREWTYVCKDGRHLCVSLVVTVVRSDSGIIIGYLGIAQDITQRKQAEAALQDSEHRYRTLFESASDAVLVINDGRFIDCNLAATQIFNCAREDILGLEPSDLSPSLQPDGTPSDAAARRLIAQALGGQTLRFEWRHRRANGEEFDAEVTLNAIRVHESTYLVVFVRDISERKRAEESLRLAASIFEASSEGMLITDAEARIVSINPAFTRITGYGIEDALGQNPSFLGSGRQDAEFYATLWKALHDHGQWRGEIWNRRKNGEIYAEQLTINAVRDGGDQVRHYIGLFSDITEKKHTDELVWQHANFDMLTHLPNRRLFRDRLEQAIRKTQRNGLALALLFIDLDRFKEINDTLGHDSGDLVLVEAARRISACIRAADTVARLGGDEFTVILPDLGNKSPVDRVAEDIIRALTNPIPLAGEWVHISASIGITLYPADATEAEDLIRNADQAMYVAKSQGRDRYAYFTVAMRQAAQMRLRLLNDLRAALVGREFELHFQPIVEIATGRVAKAEALLRWRHPLRGLISPGEFIPLAEESGLIHEIGDWVFRTAAHYSRHWGRHYGGVFQISINKSPLQFQKTPATPWPDYLREQGIPAGGIAVEITEGLLLNAIPAVVERLLEFRDVGIQVAIDDFGTGYSSLAYLKKFDIDFLKIDQSFVRSLDTETSDRTLTEAMIAMAHKLGLKVIAEGVETEAQRDWLAAAGCDYAQGYWYARPMPADEFETWMLSSVKVSA